MLLFIVSIKWETTYYDSTGKVNIIFLASIHIQETKIIDKEISSLLSQHEQMKF
jgi:hypothetical protein